MKNYTKRTISQVRKSISNTGKWQGICVGNKVNEFHFEAGWHLGISKEFTSIEELHTFKNNSMFYLEPELGNNVAFYEVTL